ncbi:MAG: hypothetical protein ABSB19_05155 [Methylomonas sp.]|jgi:hypothetical protein
MSLARYGFQKLVLLNSAGYSRAELPLDDSVSIIAPNNTGKTSLINALQFLLIIDKRHMDFGAHSFDNSRRFYFPDNSAYILLEVLLPSGMAVIGCVGKGLSHDFEYFAYQGSLDLDDYRLDNQQLVSQPKLINRLIERGKLARIYQQADLRSLLYGNRQKQRADDPDLTIFPLEFTSQAATYQRILTRTLRLDRLDSRQVKEYLLEIYKNDLLDRSVDFKSEWDKAFSDVNYDKAQYDAVHRNQTLIAKMAESHQARRKLRGKLILWRPLIEHGLNDWEAYYNRTNLQIQQELQDLSAKSVSLEIRQKDIYKELAETNSELKTHEKTEQRHQELTVRFQFVSDLPQLETHRQNLQEKRDDLVRDIKNAEQQHSAESVERNIAKSAQELADLQQQLSTLDNNLFLLLQASLPSASFDLLSRLLAKPVLSLAVGSDSSALLHDESKFRSFAGQLAGFIAGYRLELPGLSLDLSTLSANLTIKSAQELEAEIEECQKRLDELNRQLQTLQTLAEQKRLQAGLDQKIAEMNQDIKDFQELLNLKSGLAARQLAIADLQSRLETLGREEEMLAGNKTSLAQQHTQLESKQNRLKNQQQRVNQARNLRIDHQAPFDFLDQLPYLPCMQTAELDMPALADQIEGYNQDCQNLRLIDRELDNDLAALHREGVTKFQSHDTPEQELDALINYTTQLSQEKLAIDRKARSAVVQIAAILRDLRDSLERLKRRMNDFNKKINHRQLSDLKVFKIEPREEEVLVNAIKTLISTSEQLQSGDSFDLFDHNAVLDDKELNRAKDKLIKEGEARGSLRVEHLFRLIFIIAKENQSPAEFEDIDSAASNGTVLMVKLITGLAMLNQMQDQRKTIKTACYLDEAASLDQRNQRNLIDTAAEFGFSLIFASPEPQITARYCVPIGTVNGKNHISRLNWQIFETLPAAPGQ